MRRIIESPIVLATLTAALLAGSGPADAARGYKQAQFKLEFEGVQTTEVENFHEPAHQCDYRDFSTGEEVVQFRQRKAVTLTLAKVKGERELIAMYGNGEPELRAVARVERSYSPDVTPAPPPPACGGGNGGGGEPTPPDCGTRTVNPWKVGLDFPRAGRVSIVSQHYMPRPLFQACPGGAFPELVSRTFTGDRITAKLPHSEVFDSRIGKLITIGRGTRNFFTHDYDETTDVRWEITLRRIKG